MCFARPLKQRNEFFLSGEFIDGPVKDRKTLSKICIYRTCLMEGAAVLASQVNVLVHFWAQKL